MNLSTLRKTFRKLGIYTKDIVKFAGTSTKFVNGAMSLDMTPEKFQKFWQEFTKHCSIINGKILPNKSRAAITAATQSNNELVSEVIRLNIHPEDYQEFWDKLMELGGLQELEGEIKDAIHKES